MPISGVKQNLVKGDVSKNMKFFDLEGAGEKKSLSLKARWNKNFGRVKGKSLGDKVGRSA
jgi:hypothetical protein